MCTKLTEGKEREEVFFKLSRSTTRTLNLSLGLAPTFEREERRKNTCAPF
jgi:hypothetical protein